MDWMHLDDVHGKINCPQCNARLGAYNWSGTQCSCKVAFLAVWGVVQIQMRVCVCMFNCGLLQAARGSLLRSKSRRAAWIRFSSQSKAAPPARWHTRRHQNKKKMMVTMMKRKA